MVALMRSYLPCLPFCVALSITAVGPAPVSWAGQSETVSGDFVVSRAVPVGIEDFGSTCIIELDTTFAFLGSLEGAFDAQFTILHFGSCLEPAFELFLATGTYTGSVLGAEGSFDFVFIGQITEAGEATGSLIVTSGSGALEGLRGRITLAGTAGVGGGYAGRVWLDD